MYAYTSFDRQFVTARAQQYRDQLERWQAGLLSDEAFKPLSPRYAAIKKHKHRAGDKPILVNTGALLESITPKVSVRPGRG
jgi:hypothetical protein